MSHVELVEFSNYKDYINSWVASFPKSGRGKYQELSKCINSHSTLVSQIFKGEREISYEHAYQVCEHLNLSELETEYFLCLVSINKAGNYKLKDFYEKKRINLLIELSKIQNKVTKQKLGEEQKALFYSNWYFSAVRLATSIDGLNSAENIAHFLNLPVSKVEMVLEFLLSVSLVKRQKNELMIGPILTYIDPDSPFVSNHHRNWRVKAIERHPDLGEDEFCFTGPLSINKKDAGKVKKILKEAIGQISDIVKNSDDVDELYAVSIDWFKPIVNLYEDK